MMMFQPTVKDFIIAHPLPLFLLWLPIAGFLGYRAHQNWDYLDPAHQVVVAFIFSGWGMLLLLSLPKVWWHCYQKRKHKLAGIDPELLSRQRRRRANVVFSLAAVGLFEYVTYFLNSHTSAENPPQYMTAVGLAGSLSLLPFVLFYRSSRSWSSYLFLALIFLFGVAGVWHISQPSRFLDTYPELVALIHDNPQASFYLTLTPILCVLLPPLIVLVTISLKAGSWLKVRGDKPVLLPETPFTVTWCLPIPRNSPSAKAAIVPDYCQQILAGSKKVAA